MLILNFKTQNFIFEVTENWKVNFNIACTIQSIHIGVSPLYSKLRIIEYITEELCNQYSRADYINGIDMNAQISHMSQEM